MDKLRFGLKHTLLIMGIAAMLMCGIVIFSHRAALPGLVIGIITSFLYQLLLHYQLRKCSSLQPAQAAVYLKRSVVPRFCLALTGILLVLHAPGPSIIGFAAGILVPFRLVVFCNLLAGLQEEFDRAPAIRRCGSSVTHPLLHGRGYIPWGNSYYNWPN